MKAIPRIGVAAVAVSVLITGCGGPRQQLPEGDDTMAIEEAATLEDALQQVKRIVDATAEEVFPGHATSLQPHNEEPRTCLDEIGGPSDEVATSYGLEIALERDADARRLLEAGREHWENAGYEVDAEHIDDSPPAIFVQESGYSFELLVNQEVDKAFVGGTTPCYRLAD